MKWVLSAVLLISLIQMNAALAGGGPSYDGPRAPEDVLASCQVVAAGAINPGAIIRADEWPSAYYRPMIAQSTKERQQLERSWAEERSASLLWILEQFNHVVEVQFRGTAKAYRESKAGSSIDFKVGVYSVYFKTKTSDTQGKWFDNYLDFDLSGTPGFFEPDPRLLAVKRMYRQVSWSYGYSTFPQIERFWLDADLSPDGTGKIRIYATRLDGQAGSSNSAKSEVEVIQLKVGCR